MYNDFKSMLFVVIAEHFVVFLLIIVKNSIFYCVFPQFNNENNIVYKCIKKYNCIFSKRELIIINYIVSIFTNILKTYLSVLVLLVFHY